MKLIKYALLVAAIAPAVFLILPVDRTRLYPNDFNSICIYDRNGESLREALSFDYQTSVWVPLERISPWMILATIIREDKRFLFHPGLDVFALLRAASHNIRKGRVISGGSTITMQVAKMALRLKGRNLLNKALEMAYALKLELHLSKAEIIQIYLNRIPYGNQTYGVEAAARFYFRKNANQLSLGESCMLALIPRAPTLLNPYAAPGVLTHTRSSLLTSMRKRGCIDDITCQMAMQEPVQLVDQELNFEAPHFVDYILGQLNRERSSAARIITTIDLSLQKDLQKLLSTTLRSMKGYNVNQGAIIVMDVNTGEILAMVGSRDYFDAREGQVNGCISARQPGSTIKPFLYALAIQSGMRLSDVLPDTLVEFRLQDGTLFAPRNYGHRYHGPTRMREALASSFNVPAVYLIEKLGVNKFYYLLQRLGFTFLDKGALHYGLSLGLGAGEVTLLELVNAYRVFMLQGTLDEVRTIRAMYDRQGNRITQAKHPVVNVFSAETAHLITDMLSDNTARFKAFDIDNALHLPFTCAVKTGTSKDYRDNWCVGYTTAYAVGVWVGNFSGAPMQGVSGISGAAPLFRSIMVELHRDNTPTAFYAPKSLIHRQICARSGKIASPRCSNLIEETFTKGSEPVEICESHAGVVHSASPLIVRKEESVSKDEVKIVNPKNGDIYKIDPQVSNESQRIKFSIIAGTDVQRIAMRIDESPLQTQELPFEYLWSPTPGEHTLEIMDDSDHSSNSLIKFKVY
jgi:penicillin-binding protein 1C